MRKRVVKKKPVIKLIPPKYDRELLKQIKEIKEFPNQEAKTENPIQVVKNDTSASIAIIRAAGLLYDFQNPVKTEADIKKLTEDQKQYTQEELQKAFNVTNDNVVSEYSSVYKPDQLWKFHEAIRVNGSYANAQEKTFDFVTGIDYSHLETDVNDSYPDKDMKSIELETINNNFIVHELKNALEEIDRKVDLRHKILSLMISKRTFARGAQKIILNEVTKLPEAIEIMFPMLLGRVFYTERTKQIVGVEYDDPKESLIPATKLIYAVNRDYGQSPASLFYGYSDVEFFQHLIETNFIIDAYDLKELNRTQYVSKKLIQVLDQDDNIVTSMKKAIQDSDIVVSKIPVKVDPLGNEHSGNFLVDERNKNEDKITQESGIPNVLMGRTTSDTYAIVNQVMQSFNETTVKKYRMEIRSIYEPQYVNRNLKQLVRNRLEFLNQIKSKYNADRTSEVILEELLVYNKDVLSDDERDEVQLLKEEYKMQRAREKWDQYRDQFIIKRLKIIKQILNENDAISSEESTKIFEQIKLKVMKTRSFDLEDLQLPEPDKNPPPVPTQMGFMPRAKPEVKPMNGEVEKPKAQVIKAGNDDPIKKDEKTKDAEIKDSGDEFPPDYSDDWQDTSLPSPSTIEFEIQELEKLVVLDPIEYPFKYKMVFPTVSLLTDLEKSASVISQTREGILDLDDAREKLGYEDIVNREQLKNKLQDQLMDIIKKFAKPEPMMPLGNNMRDLPLTQEQMLQELVNGKSKDMQKEEQKKPTVGINLERVIKSQGEKKPNITVDKTSIK